MRKLLLTYYGDDLTGSTDVMEALALHGVKTVLFMHPPSPDDMAAFKGYEAIGLAGSSRSQTPEWMEQNLRPAFAWLKSLDAELCHYKICSTFDSSPRTGSIGRAIEIGREVFDQKMIPLIVGAPQLKRYTFAGHLFAAYRGKVYRIDRHPVMSRHPVTPMHESDLLLHLAAQTASVADIRLIDVHDEATQVSAGHDVWNSRAAAGRFVVGSSGVEYALLAEWKRLGLVRVGESFAPPAKLDRIAVVSGSCSPTTERQIRHALANGFTGVALDPVQISGNPEAVTAAIESGQEVLKQGRSVIFFTALGPETDRGREIDGRPDARRGIGAALGRIMRELIVEAGLKRVIIAGGDTSSHALNELGITALTLRFPLPATPGSPLCKAHASDANFDGLEIALKGGQVGHDDYFVALRDGMAQG